MQNQILEEYINTELDRGVARDDIREVLLKEGWESSVVDEALKSSESKTESVSGTALEKSESVAPGQTITTSPDEKKPLPKMLILGVVIILLLIAGAVYYGYNYLYFSPERITLSMFQAMGDVKSFEYKGNLEIKTEPGSDFGATNDLLPTPDTISSTLTGAVDLYDVDRQKLSLAAGLRADDYGMGMYSLAVDGSDFYFKIMDLGVLGGLVQTDLSESDWIKIDFEELNEKYSVSSQTSGVGNVESADLERLGEIFTNNNFIQFDEKLSDEDVEGINSYHLSYTIDRQKLKSFLLEIAREFGDDESYTEYSIQVDNFIGGLKSANGELWVAKKGHYLTGISINLVFVDDSTGDNYEVSLNLKLGSHNESDLVEVPTSFITLDEFINSYLGDAGISVGQDLDVPVDPVNGFDSYDLQPDYLPKDLQDAEEDITF